MDTRVAENAKRLWLGETPSSGGHGGDRKSSECHSLEPTQVKRDANAILARLKRDHPDLAQQVVDGGMSATKAARAVGARIVRSGSRLKERAIYNL